jgi:hypothetical protein
VVGTKTLLGAVAVLAALALLGAGMAISGGRSAATANDGLFAALKGVDKDGRGSFSATVTGKKKLCFGLVVKKIDKPVAAHIHKGGKGEDGPVVVTLGTPPNGKGSAVADCATGPAGTIADILDNPKGFYVNVHTEDNPGGAIRGQLFSKRP